MSTINGECKDFLEPKERAATQLHSYFKITNLFNFLPLKSLPSKDLKYGLNIAAKKNH